MEPAISTAQVAFKGHTFVPAVIGNTEATRKLYKFSQRETGFLHSLLTTGSLKLASAEIGVAEEIGKRYLKRAHIKAFLEEKFKEAALHSGTTVENQMAWLRDVRDGAKEVSEKQLEASKIIARLLRPEGKGVQINLQNNITVGASPYDGMSAPQIAEALKLRASAIEAPVDE